MTNQSGAGLPTGPASGVLGGTYPAPTYAGGGSYPPLGSAFGYLAADFTATNANQVYDIVTLALTAGTWLLLGTAQLQAGTANANMELRLWDGVTAYGSNVFKQPVQFNRSAQAVVGVAVLAGTVTMRFSTVSDQAGTGVLASTGINGIGNNSSLFAAVRIA